MPAGATGFATKVKSSEATLNGIVNPNGATTKYYFQYGTTESYSKTTTEESVSSGTTNVEKSKAITGLTASTKYDFRVVTTNSNGTTDGLNQTFTTAAPSWSLQTTPNPTGSEFGVLYGVSCSAPAECTAVGYYRNSLGVMTLAERWNGTEWSIQSTPNPSGSKESLLLGVSCSSSASCTAVGTYEAHGRNEEAPLIEHWNGTEWSIQAAPNHGEPFRSVLYSVSCTSSTACIAVGDYEESSSPYNYDTLAERWNGTEWTLQSTPNPSGRTGESNYLTVSGVSCTASNACTAVGWYATKGFEEGKTILAERWNGTEWTIQSTPMPAESSGQLHDVSCTSSTACTAIGFYGKGSEAGNLTENWNGTAWSDHVQSGFNTLFGISCSSSIACIGVGSAYGSTVVIAAGWNGTEWSEQTAPDPSGAKESHITRISCSSSTTCTDVGWYVNSAGTYVTLAEIYH